MEVLGVRLWLRMRPCVGLCATVAHESFTCIGAGPVDCILLSSGCTYMSSFMTATALMRCCTTRLRQRRP